MKHDDPHARAKGPWDLVPRQPPREFSQRTRVASLERRVGHFRRLIIWPVIVGATALAWIGGDERGCFSPLPISFLAAGLELLASYYVAGTVVGTLTWLKDARAIGRPLLMRLWILGAAGFVSAVLVAVQLLAWRCR